jgi:hypothetical protein
MQISTQILQQATAPQSVSDWFTSVFAEATVNEQDTLDAARVHLVPRQFVLGRRSTIQLKPFRFKAS